MAPTVHTADASGDPRLDAMAIEVRRATADDQEAAHALRQQAFTARSEPFDRQLDSDWYAPLDRRVVALDAGQLVGHAATWPFRQHFGGVPLPMAGVSGVAVRADARGRGTASALLRALLEDCHERGDLVSSLYPANTALYRRHGWEHGGTRTVRTIPSATLATLPRPDERLVVRPAKAGDVRDLAAVAHVHDAAMDAATGTLLRPDAYAARVVSGRDGHETYLLERDGEPVAHVWWERRPATSDDFVVHVHEIVGVDRRALLSAWRLVASWHPTIDEVRAVGSPADPLGWLLDSGKPELPVEVEQWMLRLVDVPAALQARGYAHEPHGSVALHVHDASAPWNDGAWVVSFDAGRASAVRGGPGTVRVDVGTLAAVFSGWLPVRQAVLLGTLVGADDDAAALLRRAFEGPTPWMLSFF